MSNDVKIRERETTVKGKTYSYWLVDCGLVDGKRKTKQFRSKSSAERYATKQRVQRRKYGEMAFQLSDAQREDAAKAVELLKGRATLQEAVRFFVAHTDPKAGKHPLADIIRAYIDEARADNLRPRSIKDMEYRLEKLTGFFGGRMICEITRNDAENWMRSLRLRDDKPMSELSKRHYRTVAGGLFNYALEHDCVAENPFAYKTSRRRRNGGLLDEKLPGILTVTEIEAMLRAAETHVPVMVPVLAIGFYTGLRTTELQQLDWKYIDLQAKLLTVSPEIAKRRSVRHVDISENLAAWLLPHRKETGFVAPQATAWRYNLDKVVRLAKIEYWPHNAMRHCFASYYLAMHQDQNKTALQLGHRDTNLLYNHYRNLVTKPDAEQYWSIKPNTQLGVGEGAIAVTP
jgi:integrase